MLVGGSFEVGARLVPVYFAYLGSAAEMAGMVVSWDLRAAVMSDRSTCTKLINMSVLLTHASSSCHNVDTTTVGSLSQFGLRMSSDRNPFH